MIVNLLDISQRLYHLIGPLMDATLAPYRLIHLTVESRTSMIAADDAFNIEFAWIRQFYALFLDRGTARKHELEGEKALRSPLRQICPME